MLLRRQDALAGVWETTVNFEPGCQGEEAGTTVWWSKWAFASAGIRGKNGDDNQVQREIVFKRFTLENDDIKVR